jgi:ubiquinone/menaquinone biosynthesis C-methylase UbiE
MSHHASKVKQQFGGVANAYLSSSVHSQGEDLEAIAQRLSGTPDSAVLDMGCGAGHVSFAAAPHVGSVVAYDLSSDMLRTVAQEARKRAHQNILTRQGRAESLPFQDASFDFVCTRYSAHHWTEIRTALKEARRVLKPGGGLIVTDTCAPENPLFDTHLQAIELLRDESHVRNYSPAEWNSMLTEAGFAVNAQSMRRLPLDFTAWVTRMRTQDLYVQAISSLLLNSPREVREYFQVESDGSFVLDTIMIEAH